MKKILVIGAGVTGLSIAWKLNKEQQVTVLERRKAIGGISSTFKHKDYKLDYGPHKIYTQMPNILNEIKDLLKNDDLLKIPKKSRVRLKGKYFDYPMGLTAILKMNPLIGFKCGINYFESLVKNVMFKKEEISYKDYLVNRFGKGVYQLVFEPYAIKVWGNPEELSAELARTRISIPSLMIMLKNMVFGNKNKPEISADEFYYPKKGIIQLSNRMLESAKQKECNLLKETKIKSIILKNNKVTGLKYELKGKEKKIPTDVLISTAPLTELPFLIENTPEEIKNAAKALKHRSLILAYLVIDKDRLFEDNWIFFPEKEFIFNRVSEQKGFSKEMIPEGKTVLTVEVTCSPEEEMWNCSKEKLYGLIIEDLEKAGLTKKDEVKDYFFVKIKNIYPVYSLDFKENMDKIIAYIDSIENLYTNGRQGLFNYNNMDHCIDMGIKLAEHINANKSKEEWFETRKIFEDYKIVD